MPITPSAAKVSSKERPGIFLKGTARMGVKTACEAFPVPEMDSAFRAGSQITSACSGRGLLRLARSQEQRVVASVVAVLLRKAGHAAEAEC